MKVSKNFYRQSIRQRPHPMQTSHLHVGRNRLNELSLKVYTDDGYILYLDLDATEEENLRTLINNDPDKPFNGMC